MNEPTKDKFNRLLSSGKTILFVGVGNALKSDDGIGIYICNNIRETLEHRILIVESGIEKFVGKINSIEPDILVLVDCTDFSKSAGFFDLVPIETILDHTMHTHTISLKRISEFFTMETWLLGVQPKNVMFGEELSEEILNTADQIIEWINSYIK